MPKKSLTKNLKDNIQLIKDKFDDDMLKVREILNIYNDKTKITIIYFGLLVNREYIQTTIVKPILEFKEEFESKDLINTFGTSIINSSEFAVNSDIDEICYELMQGKTILLIDGYKDSLLIETNDRISRSPTEPEAETVLRGPRVGFNESLMNNISLLRRILLNTDLKFTYLKMGKETNVYMAYTYIEGLVDTRALKEFEKKLYEMNLDAVVDSNAVAEAISYRGLSPLEIVGQTERPDNLAAKLLEGKIGVMLDGSPVVLTLPFLFAENFQTSEDYYVSTFFASVSRLARIVGFLISTLLPGLYVAIITYHWEIVPTRVALSILQAQEGLTLPTPIEAIFMLAVFEILRETGIRTPSGLGQSMSIVGALVVGQSAIQARIASPIMVIIVSLTAMTALINYKLKGATIFFRILVLIAGTLFGLYGIAVCVYFILFHLFSKKSFGVQYTELFFPFKKGNLKDTFIRATGEGISRLDDKDK
jgi:spore germination protein KA